MPNDTSKHSTPTAKTQQWSVAEQSLILGRQLAYNLCSHLYEWRILFFILLISLFFILLIDMVLNITPIPMIDYFNNISFLLACLLFLIFFGKCIYILGRCLKNKSIKKVLLSSLSIEVEKIANIEYLTRILMFIYIFTLSTHVVDNIKGVIPLLQPYKWDHFFVKLDRLLLLGHSPWQLIQALHLDHPYIIKLLDDIYLAWFMITPLTVAFTIGHYEYKKTLHFMLAYTLTWLLLGNLTAILFSSVGPCFYHIISPPLAQVPSEIQHLLHMLSTTAKHHNIMAVKEQIAMKNIWSRLQFKPMLGIGISAFPSLHVGIAVLNYLFFRQYVSKYLVTPALIFAILTLIGSVVLGWHYLSDGVAAWIGTWFIWTVICPKILSKSFQTYDDAETSCHP